MTNDTVDSIDDVVVHAPYEKIHDLRVEYWKNKFYGMQNPKTKDYFDIVHSISALYAGDKKYGVTDTNKYFNDCMLRIIDCEKFHYFFDDDEDMLKFASALTLNDHKGSVKHIDLMKGNYFEILLEDYLKTRFKPK